MTSAASREQLNQVRQNAKPSAKRVYMTASQNNDLNNPEVVVIIALLVLILLRVFWGFSVSAFMSIWEPDY